MREIPFASYCQQQSSMMKASIVIIPGMIGMIPCTLYPVPCGVL